MPAIDLPGVRLHYSETGNGTPLIMSHGSAVDAETWATVSPALSKSARVITYDRRGYGQSAHKPVRDHRLHCDDLIALIEQTCDGPADVLGWSAGGNVAIAAAIKRPDLFRKLIVVEAPFHGLRHMSFGVVRTALKLKTKQLLGAPIDALAVFLRFGSELRSGGNSFDMLPEDVQQGLLKYWAPVLAEWDPHPFGIMHEHISKEAVRQIPVPMTWILGAEGSPWLAGLHDRIKRMKPELKTVIVPKAGHLVHMDAPDAFIAAVLDEIS